MERQARPHKPAAAKPRASRARSSVDPRPEAGAPAQPTSAASRKPDDWLSEIAPGTRTKLANLGIASAFDLVLHLPLRYEDETRLVSIHEAPHGQTVLVEGEIVHSEITYRPRRTLVCQIRDSVDSEAGKAGNRGLLHIRFLNFYGSQAKVLAKGVRLRLFGEIRDGFFGAEMVHPKYRVVREGEPLSAALTPVYPTTAGLSQAQLRKCIDRALATCDLTDTLSLSSVPGATVLQKLRLPDFAASVRVLHHPPPDAEPSAFAERSHPAWRRIKFDELLAQQLSMRLNHKRRRDMRAARLAPSRRMAPALLAALPFSLTAAQRKSLAEIIDDLCRPHPMQRLLQGDVGSGKTIVAALAALQAIESGYQVAVMAPTEILAEQHYRKFLLWLAPLGIKVAWLAGNLKKKERQLALAEIAEGTAALAVGTHALFQEHVVFVRLGLAIIDEQHRFGVHQRMALGSNANYAGGKPKLEPHRLMMSATPIPRTLAMTYMADLDVSLIDELPPGRQAIVTKLISEARRDEVIARVHEACRAGRQVYWVCPLIEESEKLQLQTALDTHRVLSQALPDIRVGLIHGRLASDEKAAAMQAFQGNEIQLLVATTVIEVGVDVPNASLMVIEHAERMGLSQLHQLRGRVGRGANPIVQSLCLLLYQKPLGELARERLKIIFENSDGFEIARHDLRLRGPGEFLGARQSGVPLLRFADIERDIDLLDAARDAAGQILEREPAIAERHLTRWLGDKQNYLRV
ncbi:MAG: ATP-dependent DNA helicase RecG [Burkholderiales bacterium]|nr:ATP-dependent DNA helicase RecG [Burkholderiales bacterium]